MWSQQQDSENEYLSHEEAASWQYRWPESPQGVFNYATIRVTLLTSYPYRRRFISTKCNCKKQIINCPSKMSPVVFTADAYNKETKTLKQMKTCLFSFAETLRFFYVQTADAKFVVVVCTWGDKHSEGKILNKSASCYQRWTG